MTAAAPSPPIGLPRSDAVFSLGRRVSGTRNIYFYASDSSMHGQRLVQGAAAFARLQTPRLRLLWAHKLPPLSAFADQKVEGIIYFALSEEDRRQLRQIDLPAVNTSSRNLPTQHASVTPDDHAIGQLAARHFKENLFQNFAFVGMKSHTYTQGRVAGFSEGIFPSVCHQFWLDSNPNAADTRNSLKAFIRTLPQPAAVFAANDVFARNLCEVAVELGLHVPEQIAILGVDAEQLVSLSSAVELSSVDLDSFKIGYTAAETLVRLMEDPAMEPPHITIPPKGILVAASTDHLATTDPLVSGAVFHIRQHACSGLTVDDLAETLGVGRRMLERRFNKAIGKGIDELIRKIRIERAMEMLDRSDLPIGEIADRCGFEDVFYFSRIFKKSLGKSPRAYRQGHA